MRPFSLFALSILIFTAFVGCGGTEKHENNPEMIIDEEVVKIFSSPDLKDFLSQVYTKDRNEFTYYVDELKKDSVNRGTREKLIEVLQQPENNEYYIATMLYLMAKAGIKEALPLVKNMMYHPDAYVKTRCITAFSLLANKSERNLLLPLTSNQEKFSKVRKQATEAYYAMITPDDFDALFDVIKNPEGEIVKNEDRQKFMFHAIEFCLEEKLNEKTRKQKEADMIVLIGKTSMIAEEFILEYFKGRLSSKAFGILVDLYCESDKSRKIHVLAFGEIHRLILTRKDDLNFDKINAKFVSTLIKDLTEFEKFEDIYPVDIDFILDDFSISDENQKTLEIYVNGCDVANDKSDTLLYVQKLLMTKSKYNESLLKIISNSKGNANLIDINLKGITRFIDLGNKNDKIAEVLNEYLLVAEDKQMAEICTGQLAILNSASAISYLLEGLKHESKKITEAAAFGIIKLSDKTYFTEIVREKELVEKILRNEEMEPHNIISTLKVFGDMGSSAVDAKWIEQYCPYKNQKEVKDAIDGALIEIEFRERNN